MLNRYAYDEHINAIMIRNDVLGNARLEGMEEDRAEEKNNIARKMQDNGLSIEQIALIIGLTEKEIKEQQQVKTQREPLPWQPKLNQARCGSV